MAIDAADVRERLGLGDPYSDWLSNLESAALSAPARLPSLDEAPDLLRRLGFTRDDGEEVVAAWPARGEHPELFWLLDRCHARLVQEMGSLDGFGPWPTLPDELGALGGFFYVYVFLAALPAVREYHRSRSISDEVSWATLADLGRNVGIYRRIHGRGGFDGQNWLTLHFRGIIYQLGRLQFNHGRVWWDDATLEALGAPFRKGEPALGVHIPETGPMTPEACDESFRLAPEFFARHFPEQPYRFATCGSWLLDPQLAEYLPGDSNIVRFQRRFHLLPPDGRNSDATVFMFVFRRLEPDLDALPQRSRLERAAVQHVRAGRHWQSRFGWVSLE
jgi:hypothetical protein